MSRRYKQRGYQDEEASREPRRSRSRPEDREGPRGRGLGSPSATVFRCQRCGDAQAAPAAPDETCEACGTDLHTCTHCAHFDTSAAFECRAPVAARISKKAARNDCSLFSSKQTQEFAPERPAPGDAKAAFDELFDL